MRRAFLFRVDISRCPRYGPSFHKCVPPTRSSLINFWPSRYGISSGNRRHSYLNFICTDVFHILYKVFIYFHLTHLLLPLKVHTRLHVSALSGHHQALLWEQVHSLPVHFGIPNCLHKCYDVTMLCAFVYIKVKTDIKIEVCLFENYVS